MEEHAPQAHQATPQTNTPTKHRSHNKKTRILKNLHETRILWILKRKRIHTPSAWKCFSSSLSPPLCHHFGFPPTWRDLLSMSFLSSVPSTTWPCTLTKSPSSVGKIPSFCNILSFTTFHIFLCAIHNILPILASLEKTVPPSRTWIRFTTFPCSSNAHVLQPAQCCPIVCRAWQELLHVNPFFLPLRLLPCASPNFPLLRHRYLLTASHNSIRGLFSSHFLSTNFHFLSAAVWVLRNLSIPCKAAHTSSPLAEPFLTIAFAMNLSSNIAPALARSSSFSLAIGDKLLLKKTSLSQISVRCASTYSTSTNISCGLNRCRSSQFVFTSPRHWLLDRCISIFGEAAERKMSMRTKVRMDSTSRDLNKNTNKNRTICASNEKINWTNLAGTRLARNASVWLNQ